jgi:hypothetical protein
MKDATRALMIAAAIAGLTTGTTLSGYGSSMTSGPGASASADQLTLAGTGFRVKEKHACKGQNSCKGKGGCKTGDNGCKSKNSCKGKGGCATDGSKMPA